MNLVPIVIGAYYTGNVLDNPHLAQALAFGMFVVLARDDDHLHPAAAPRRAVGRSEADAPADLAASRVIWLVLAARVLPRAARRDVRLQPQVEPDRASAASLHNYGCVIHNGEFWHTIRISFLLALETIVISLAALRPDDLLGAPEAAEAAAGDRVHRADPVRRAADRAGRRPADDVQGHAEWFYGKPWGFLVAAYVILAFPYMFFSLDAGFRAIDVHTLTEASQSLGASWPTTLFKVILPNIRVGRARRRRS